MDEYENWLDIIGDERNSCTKTDHDAIMGALKIDYYNQSGISTPCYNAQIAVSDGVIVNADIYQRPADAKTFIPLVEKYHENTENIQNTQWQMQDMGPMTTICIVQKTNRISDEISNVCKETRSCI